MQKRSPSQDAIVAMKDACDVTGLIEAYGSTKRWNTRQAIRQAVSSLGQAAEVTMLDLLGDERWQRRAGAMLVDVTEDAFPAVVGQLGADDQLRREGALHTVYLYARYRDLPAARELLRAAAAGEEAPDLAGPAAQMAARVEQLRASRNEEIDGQLARIQASIDREKVDGGSIIIRMYSRVHRERMEARLTLVGMRFAGVRHIIEVAPQFGEAAVVALLSLGIQELRGDIVPIIEESLGCDDQRRRSLLLTTLICLQRARIPGAADALERDGVEITGPMDRKAARIYTKLVKEV
jgi:hypothetical protein